MKANEVTEIHVAVDLEQQKAIVTMQGETIEAPLNRRLESVNWYGYCVAGVTSDFSKIEATGE